MKQLFDELSAEASRKTTLRYSTSFSIGIYCLNRRLHEPVYNIYGFVRFADEIVDSFLEYNREELLKEFRAETYKALDRKISLNPILNSFQATVHKYGIDYALIDTFLKSMEMDLDRTAHDKKSYDEYILGSAEVVGLMCLRVFTENNDALYNALKPAAMRLGSAFQKVNFLRDMQSDYKTLGRIYFPGIQWEFFNAELKRQIEHDIDNDFNAALEGIRQLPASSRFGVYVAFMYYRRLFAKIKSLPPREMMHSRIRIPNYQKMGLLASSFVRHSMRML
jgi:phytoene/squalene synthetase